MTKYALVGSLLLAQPAAADAPKRPAPSGSPGSIAGTVIFEGTDPVRKDVKRDTDPYCKSPAPDDVVIATKGRLKDVFVRVTNPPKKGTFVQAVLDQRDCAYTPRVLGVYPGYRIAVRNSDGTFHNVNGSVSGKLLWNKPMAAKDPDLALDATAKPGEVIEVVCNVHPWMRAYAVVIDHPFFAVSAEDGSFKIDNLPAGAYTLEAWHPKLGTRKLDIKIGTGAKAVVPARISYKNE